MGKNRAVLKQPTKPSTKLTPLLHKVKFALNPRALGDARLLALCF